MLYSKLECMQAHHDALETLLQRFKKAINEKDGKDDFRYDIKQIENDMNIVFAAGRDNIKKITSFGGFPRIKGIDNESGQYDALKSMLIMLRMGSSTPRMMRSGRKI